MKISARNILKGRVKEIKTGVVNSEVVIETLSGELIVSMVTKDSVDNLNLHVGMEVYAVIKASNVMIGID